MAKIINLKTFTDERGNLTVIERIIPFSIKRIFYIYGVDNSIRGKHKHKKTIQAAISIKGSCKIFCKSGDWMDIQEFLLDSPSKCLILNPEDYHWMDEFSPDCILMVLASEYFNTGDYIYSEYK